MKSLNKMWGRALPAMLAAATLAVVGALALNVAPGLLRVADAAVQNYPPNIPVNAMPIHLSGAYTTVITPVKFNLPYAGRLIGFSANARTISGGVNVDIQAAGVSLLSPVISIPAASAGLTIEGSINTSAVADEATISIVITPTGGSPTSSDIVVLPTFLRR